MRFMAPPAILLLATFLILFSSRRSHADELFPDKVLEKAVRQEVFEKRYNEEPLTEEDVENIAIIQFKGHTYTLEGKKVQREKIKDLTGLEKCRSLAELDLEDHHIADLAPLKDLKNLQSLTLKNNQITDIKPLAGLTKLQYLQLEDNRVTDISPVANMTNMHSLYLTNNRIKNIGPVRKLDRMWSLYLGGNRIANIDPISQLTSLDTIGLEGNAVSDLSPLADLRPSKWLFLQDNEITDISVLVAMAKKDREGRKEFAPFWNIYLGQNPLSEEARTKQLPELKKHSLASRIHHE